MLVAAGPADAVSAVRKEFAAGWPVVAGSMLGIAVGIAALPTPALGIVLRDLVKEFGWSRAEIAIGPTILLGVLALVSPVLGWIADRVSAAVITTVSLLALALCLFLFSRLGPDIRLYYALMALMAVTASGAATIVYARAISANFTAGRGRALGIAMIGNGVTGIVLPVIMAPYAAHAGWRAVFVALAAVVLLATPLVAVLIGRGRPPAPPQSIGAPVTRPALRGAVADPVFWAMCAAFLLVAVGAAGMQLHFLAYLADEGVAPATAGAIAGAIGAALIVGRLATGFLVDRLFAPHVAAAMMMLSAACMAAMAHFGGQAGFLGAIAMGLSVGAELDLVGYLTARYFGMGGYGRIYAVFYAVVLVGSSLSKVLYGLTVDLTGSYRLGLYAAAAMLAASAMIFLRMRRFTPEATGPSPQ
ncbi:MFS transporter [Phenylobacterium conjunctum]|uniref:MFS transporter n=1 Tax=Phenylobacterium conjunctum TaxID=1298959 RepID=A0ABW3T1H9_9CAUL